MVNESATTYFHKLSDLLRRVQVTDGHGTALSLDQGAEKAVDIILSVVAAGGKVMVIGNGGSAAIASHMQNDLSKNAGVRAMVFNEPPLLMAISNDHGYKHVFERPVELWANTGDLLLAISSSGESENILRGVQASVACKCRVITLSGFNAGNSLRQMGQLNFYVPASAYGFVELVHSALAHFLTDCVMMLPSGREKPA